MLSGINKFLQKRKTEKERKRREKEIAAAISLHEAVILNDIEKVKRLLKKGANPSFVFSDGTSAFSAAIELKKIQIIKLFALVNPNEKCTGDGNTPLHLACEANELGIVKIFEDAQVNPNLTNNNGDTPLHTATKEGIMDMVIPLLHDFKADTSIRNAEGLTPIQLSANKESDELFEDDEDVLAELLEQSKKEDLIFDDGQTILHSLVFEQTLLGLDNKLINAIVMKAGIDTPSKQSSRTALHVALANRDIDTALVLLKKGANPNALDQNKESPLHYAITKKDLALVKLLLKYGANPNLCNANGESPLHLATKNELTSIVNELVNAGADIDLKSPRTGDTPLHFAAKQNTLPIMGVLHKARPNEVNHEGDTPLHVAVSEGVIEPVFELLHVFKADPNIVNNSGYTPLQLLAEKKDEFDEDRDIMGELLETGANPNIVLSNGTPLLHKVTENKDKDNFDIMLDRKADTSLFNSEGEGALHVAVRGGKKKFVASLVKHGSPDVPRKGDGMTALHLAVMNGEMAMVDGSFRSYNADSPNLITGNTPVHTAVETTDLELLESVLFIGADPNTKNHKGDTPLHFAVKRNDDEMCQALLDEWADPNIPDARGNTALHWAAVKGNEYLIQILLNEGALTTKKNANGKTAFDLLANQMGPVAERLKPTGNNSKQEETGSSQDAVIKKVKSYLRYMYLDFLKGKFDENSFINKLNSFIKRTKLLYQDGEKYTFANQCAGYLLFLMLGNFTKETLSSELKSHKEDFIEDINSIQSRDQQMKLKAKLINILNNRFDSNEYERKSQPTMEFPRMYASLFDNKFFGDSAAIREVESAYHDFLDCPTMGLPSVTTESKQAPLYPDLYLPSEIVGENLGDDEIGDRAAPLGDSSKTAMDFSNASKQKENVEIQMEDKSTPTKFNNSAKSEEQVSLETETKGPLTEDSGDKASSFSNITKTQYPPRLFTLKKNPEVKNSNPPKQTEQVEIKNINPPKQVTGITSALRSLNLTEFPVIPKEEPSKKTTRVAVAEGRHKSQV